MAGLHFDCSAICASFVKTVGELKVSPAFPCHRRHARHCLPALFRVLPWVPWALVPHVSGQGPLLSLFPRYCALLRLPPSIPVGLLVAPFRYLGLTRFSLCPSQLALGSVRPLAASTIGRQGVVYSGRPCSGSCSQGDGRLSRVPGLPLWAHAPLSDPGGVPPACLDAVGAAAFRSLQTVGFGSVHTDLSTDHHYTFFGVQSRGLRPCLPSASVIASQQSPFGSAIDPVASLGSSGILRLSPRHPLGNYDDFQGCHPIPSSR